MSALYHYTSERHHLPMILASGELRGRADMEGERPLVWFSAHPFWEPTATKPRWTGGLLVPQTFEEYSDVFGCVRFALPADDGRLMDWRRACKFARIPKRDRWAMESIGKEAGGDPRHWLAVVGPVPLEELKVERLEGNQWQPMEVRV
ncbi:hypothetical protein [Halomonas chromatireducens]|uniref:Uncharacterized protein n=1 Tax=Halomonas chromatireducens TaxID=507626 RepID=A0A0X8HB15_9GAMM|nr:hypothetical protein [Halomonas chromatireducens]AMC99350.1 hypothetical protein LOKO_00254 [Halomonas chromatireducens]